MSSWLNASARTSLVSTVSWWRLTGVFHSCQAEGRAVLRGGGGSIVNIGSIPARSRSTSTTSRCDGWPTRWSWVGPTVFLLSDAGSYCTGTELVVDGGAVSW